MRPGPRTLARVAALGLVAAAFVSALRSGGDGQAGGGVTHPQPDDPLAVELRRCAALGRAAQDDWLCKRLAEVPSPTRPGEAATPMDQSRLPSDPARPQAGRPEDE
jgi:conjugative transfer region protein TrbK